MPNGLDSRTFAAHREDLKVLPTKIPNLGRGSSFAEFVALKLAETQCGNLTFKFKVT
jgi:hypothetical protein